MTCVRGIMENDRREIARDVEIEKEIFVGIGIIADNINASRQCFCSG